jgi:hypothetical protein
MGKGDEWFDWDLDLGGDDWDLQTPGIPMNPKNYRRLMGHEIDRVHRQVADCLDELCEAIAKVERKREARMRKEFGQQIRQMKSRALEEARAEIRRSLNADEAVVDLGELRRHGRAEPTVPPAKKRRRNGMTPTEVEESIAAQQEGSTNGK